MFVFDPDYTFDWPVTVKIPADGGDQEFTFTATFRVPEDEAVFFEPVTGETQAERLNAARARLSQYWCGWKGVQVKGGGELTYSEEAKARLLGNRHIRIAVDGALFDAMVGVREKN